MFRLGEKEREFRALREIAESLPQRAIVGHATGEPKAPPPAPSAPQNLPGLAGQRIDDRRLITRAKIGHRCLQRLVGHFLHRVAEARLQSRERELGLSRIEERPWKSEGVDLSVDGLLLDQWSPRIGHAEQFCAFIEGFTGRIVESFRQNLEGEVGPNLEKNRVSAGNDQAKVRKPLCEAFAKRRRIFGVRRDKGRKGVSAQVIHPDERSFPRQRQSLRERQTERQASGQPRPGSHCEGLRSSITQLLLRQSQQTRKMS